MERIGERGYIILGALLRTKVEILFGSCEERTNVWYCFCWKKGSHSSQAGLPELYTGLVEVRTRHHKPYSSIMPEEGTNICFSPFDMTLHLTISSSASTWNKRKHPQTHYAEATMRILPSHRPVSPNLETQGQDKQT